MVIVYLFSLKFVSASFAVEHDGKNTIFLRITQIICLKIAHLRVVCVQKLDIWVILLASNFSFFAPIQSF